VLNAFRSRKMAVILVLGFASGLPLYLTSRTLQAWMTVAGVNLTAIGFSSLLSLPYSLKFLWAPFIDRFSLPLLGRRKGWLIATEVALAGSIGAMAFARPAQALQFVVVIALAIAFFSATQDITVDAYVADVCSPSEAGAGSGIKVLGYRVAMIAAGAGALVMADFISWPAVYAVFGLIMLLLALASLRVPEPVLRDKPPSSIAEAVRLPLSDFFLRAGKARGACILAFIVLYRLGDALINNMATSFLLQMGFTQTDVGVVQGGVGLAATIVGVLVGGAIMSRIGINRSLWVFGILQGASNAAYFILAETGRNYPLMIGAITVEHFCTGLGTAALVAFLMVLCDPRFSATQYALLSSLVAIGRDVMAAPGGSIAARAGWPVFFLLSIAAAVPGLMLLPFFNTEACSAAPNKLPVPIPREQSY
jgi:PAT family beta-lactamase induction signal transducer AmpG